MKKHPLLTKNVVVSLLLVFLLILSGCSQGVGAAIQVLQEPTDTLTIYIPPNLRFQLRTAIRMFEQEFPHVQIEVRTFTEDHPQWAEDAQAYADSFILDVRGMEEFNQALRNGLITDRGPDVVIWYDMETGHGIHNTYPLPYSLLTFPDLFKTAAWTELFLDLEPLFSADHEFNREDYVQGVFDVGLIGERRFFVPLMYQVPLLVTTEEALAYFGLDIDFDEELSFEQLMEIIEQFIDENKPNPERFLFPPPDRGLRYIFPWIGEPIIDYYSGTVNINNDTFRNAMYSYKMMYEITTQRSSCSLQNIGWEMDARWHRVVPQDIYNRNVLFNFTMGYRTFGGTYTQLSNATEGSEPPWADFGFLNESPVWFPIRSVDGVPVAQPVVYAAIPRATPNQHNAYEFLRILMSERWQHVSMHSSEFGMEAYPINKQALLSAMDSMYRIVDAYDQNVIWWWAWYLPPQTEEEWLNLVWSAVADENFTHTSLRIVHEYMLPFFRGEQTFEESVSRLENKLTLYVGE